MLGFSQKTIIFAGTKHKLDHKDMKKFFLSIAAFLLVCLAFYGWNSPLQQSSLPQMQAYYQESVGLGSVPADSASRFIVNFMGYTMLNPHAQFDPLYPEIESNIQKYSATH